MTQLAAGTACAPHFTEIRVTVGRERRAPRLNATALPAVGPACSLVRATAWTLVHASTVALVRCMCLSREAVACARLVCLGPNSCVVRINLVAAIRGGPVRPLVRRLTRGPGHRLHTSDKPTYLW